MQAPDQERQLALGEPAGHARAEGVAEQVGEDPLFQHHLQAGEECLADEVAVPDLLVVDVGRVH